MTTRDWGFWYWSVWLAVVAVSLGVPEFYALATNARNTLSDYVWARLEVSTGQQLPWTAAHYLVFGAWVVFFSWLTWHFFFRRFT
jgi:hypothetical protein